MSDRLPPRSFFVVAAALLGVTLLLIIGTGTDLPGPPVRQWLGLADASTPAACTSPTRVLAPVRPPPGRGQWRAEPSMPLSLVETRAARVGGRIYIGTGFSPRGVVATMLAFDPATRRYERVPDAPDAVDHTVLVGWGGSLYLLAGFSDGRPARGFWRYEPGTRRWRELAPMPMSRGAMAGAVIGDRLYVVGGAPAKRSFPPEEFVKAPAYSAMEVYDFRSGAWTRGPDMPTPRHHLAAAAAGGDLFVVGGRRPGNLALRDVARFDPERGRWSAGPPLPQGAGALEAVGAAGRVIAISGGDDSGWWEGKGFVTPAVWSLDPRRSYWSRLPNLAVPRHGHSAAFAAGRVWVFAGIPCPGEGVTRTAESLPVG